MPLVFSRNELHELMQNFHTLTGIRIVLFDETCTEIFAYPANCVPFCSAMRNDTAFYNRCCESDKNSFEICRRTKSFHMYKCHAGLIECTAPIMDNDSIIGYIMFGQVGDDSDKKVLREKLNEICKSYVCSENIADSINQIKFKKQKQLTAASKILEACVSYILYNEMVKPSRVKLFYLIDDYISSHLSDNLSIEILCKTFAISRTRLYELMSQYLDEGISSYIKKKRLNKAKELLKYTDIPITDIAAATGFSDYNYFLRSFKKHFGISTKELRNKQY